MLFCNFWSCVSEKKLNHPHRSLQLQIKVKFSGLWDFYRSKYMEKRAQGISFLTVACASSSVCIYRATVRGRAVWPSACFSIIKFTGRAETPKSLSGRDLWAKLRCSPSRSSQCIIENHPSQDTASGSCPVSARSRRKEENLLTSDGLTLWFRSQLKSDQAQGISCWREIKTGWWEERNLEKCTDEKSRTDLCVFVESQKLDR